MLALLIVISTSTGIAAVTDDGKVKKEILRQGAADGVFPHEGDRAEIHYVGWFANGVQFDSSRDRNKTLSFVVGKTVVAGLGAAVQKMERGELANVTMEYQYGYGERGYPPVVPARSDLQYEVELIDFTPA
jgi:FKBP-type peptidyl-prolyl cis-trans isomerase